MTDELIIYSLKSIMETIAGHDERVEKILKKLQTYKFFELEKEERKLLRKACKTAVDRMKSLTHYRLFEEYDEITLDDGPVI
jgi:hypothetical protein